MSLAGSKIAFIGSGAMAEAIIKGMLSRGLVTADQIVASDPVSARQTLMAETYNVQTTGDNNQAVTGANIVVMSIKPQAFAKVAAGLQGHLAADALVLSIMAGVPMKTLKEGLAHEPIVRSMPNTRRNSTWG
ncbi:MAG: NAD(P)-binding domain-containing protein [Caldilineaceae bacterium]